MNSARRLRRLGLSFALPTELAIASDAFTGEFKPGTAPTFRDSARHTAKRRITRRLAELAHHYGRRGAQRRGRGALDVFMGRIPKPIITDYS
jgi:hypothetical protein